MLGLVEAAQFRALSAWANELALDRPDVAYATKELCRCFPALNSTAALALTDKMKRR